MEMDLISCKQFLYAEPLTRNVAPFRYFLELVSLVFGNAGKEMLYGG